MPGLTQYLGQVLKAFRRLMETNQEAKQKKNNSCNNCLTLVYV